MSQFPPRPSNPVPAAPAAPARAPMASQTSRFRYRVANGCAVLNARNNPLYAGTMIRVGPMDPKLCEETQLPQKSIDDMLLSGHLIDMGTNFAGDPQNPMALDFDRNVGRANNPVLPTGDDRTVTPVQMPDNTLRTGRPGGIQTSTNVPRVPMGKAAASLFNLNPVTLQGKGLDDLNVMIQERMGNARFEPFQDPNEAIAYLSRDFNRGV